MLAARRGFGAEDARLASGSFLEAVRWALFAERMSPELLATRQVAETDPPDTMKGTALQEFRAKRSAAREQRATLEAALFPKDEEVVGG